MVSISGAWRGRTQLFAAVLWLLTAAASAQSAAILHTVDEHYNHLTSLSARFVETYSGMGMTRTEAGTLLLKKPGRMRWAYDTPQGKLFLLDGKYAWSYTPGDAQVIRIPAAKLDDLRSPLRFLLGHTQLAKELQDISVTPQGQDFRIVGVPRGMSARVKSFTLLVSSAGAIQQMSIVETDGTTTAFTFTDQRDNLPTSPTDFVFTPPGGIPVIDGSNPI